MSPISKPEKAALASDLIIQSPPGEFKEVVSDVRTLLEDDELLKTSVYEAFCDYNMSSFTPVKVVKNSDSLVTRFAKTGDQFIDNRNRLKFGFDHIKRESTKNEKFELEPEHFKLFEPIDEEIINYVKSYYKTGNSAVYVNDVEGKTIINICIESHAYNPTNFWNGAFLCEYTLDMSSGSFKGKINAKVHYYEDGNVQLLASKTVESSVDCTSDPKTLASKIAQIISKEEQSYQAALVDDINGMMDSVFKALRRQLPITRTKIDWNKLAAYGLAQEIMKS